MSRFACVWVPFFAAAAHERCEPALRERPLAVVSAPGDSPAARIVEANGVARAAGVRPGTTEAEGRTRCAALEIRKLSREHVASARHALLEGALAVSPRVEDGGAGLVYVDTRGLDRLFGDPGAIGDRLLRQARGVGLPARVGLAPSRTAARVAATRSGHRVTVIPTGCEREALAGVPLAVLTLSADLASTLARWGITTLGQLAALPRDGIATRLGGAGLRAQDLALGRDREPFQGYAPPPFFEEAQGLEWELDSLLALGVVLRGVLERLCARLTAAHVFADALDVRLELASGERHARAVALAAPMREVAPMLALVTLDLAAHPPGAPVTGVALSARPVRARAGQGGLWQPAAPALRDLAVVLGRLATLVGADNVGSPVVLDSHCPAAFEIAPFTPPPAGAGTGTGEPHAPAADPPHLALRRLSPPRRVEVETDGERPLRVDMAPRVDAPAAAGPRAPSARQNVVRCAGPWRSSGDWWDARAWARDEWDVMLGDGTLWRLARDRITGHWSLDGAYD
ncbi:MAG: DNA polymerase Y family protein [Candidatus Rokubacteria bacterium]|nr:DNA polymerase Y family protein [Candidatus Rokubacteria bacterium]